MTSGARELVLYIENDAGLYRQQHQPIQKNLVTKMARGVYNHALAVKLFGYLVTNGAKKYAKEFSVGNDWNTIFSAEDRKQAAEQLASHFEAEAKLGNYDNYLPKKYQKKANPGVALPRNKWVNAQVMVTSSGEIKAKFSSPALSRLGKRK